MGKEIFQTVDFNQTCGLVKSINCQYLGLGVKNDQSKTTLIHQSFNVSENKVFQYL